MAAAFPSEPVRGAVLELRLTGLLIEYEPGTYNMHNLVRRGLEALLPPASAKRKHKELAEWYDTQGLIVAHIHHLSQASETADADRVALSVFLAGTHRRAVVSYIAERNLITIQQAIEFLLDPSFKEIWILRYLLTTKVAAQEIFDQVSGHPDRLDADFRFALHAYEIALRADESVLDQLVGLALKKNVAERLQPIALAMYRLQVAASPYLRKTFNSAEVDLKRQLLPMLVARLEQGSLTEALLFIDEEQLTIGTSAGHGTPTIRISSASDVDTFVGALPTRPLPELINARAPLLGVLASVPLAHVRLFTDRCRVLVLEPSSSESVRLNALRILVLLGDEWVLDAHRSLAPGTKGHTFSVLAPAMLGRRDLLPVYEAVLLNPSADRDDRMGALMIVSFLGGDLDHLMSEVLATAGKERDGWEFMFLLQSTNRPFDGMVSALRRFVQQGASPTSVVPMLSRLGQLKSTESREFLLLCFDHSDRNIRIVSGLALQERRDCDFREVLASADAENDSDVRHVKILTALSMTPPSASVFGDLWTRTPSTIAWYAVAVGRTRDFSELPRLVELVTDPSQRWQTRTASINALSLFLYRDGLGKVLPLMKERSTLVEDNELLVGHEVLSSLCTDFAGDLMQAFGRGRARFEHVLSIYVEVAGESRMFRDGMTSSKAACTWLWEVINGEPNPALGIDKAVDKLHVPLLQSALLMGIWRRGQAGVLEELLKMPSLSTWLALRVVYYLAALAKGDEQARRRLEKLVAARGDSDRIAHMVGRRPLSPIQAQKSPTQTLEANSATLSVVDLRAAIDTGMLTTNEFHIGLLSHEWEQFALELSPPNDYRTVLQATSVVSPHLSAGNALNLGQQVLRTVDNHAGARKSLRPVFAAGAPVEVAIPWLTKALAEDPAFVKDYAKAIAKLGKSAFENAIERSGHKLLLALGTYQIARPLFAHSGAFLLPSLARCVSSGNDAFFEVLCQFTTAIDSDRSETVLLNLVQRWQAQLMRQRQKPSIHVSTNLSKGFRVLSACPRTQRLSQYARLLQEVSSLPLGSYREGILTLLHNYPSAYILLESANWRVTPFYMVGDLLLDDACDSLFRANTLRD